MVILATFKFTHEVMSGLHIRNDGVLETTNLCFPGVAAVEEDNFIAALFNECVEFVRLELGSATDDALVVDFNLVWNTEGHDL